MSLVGFPLLLIPLAIYNIFVFLMPSVEFSAPIVTLTLMSRAQWTLTFGDALLALAMVLLWFEILKAARPGARFLTDHLLSLIVFAVATAEFLLFGKFGTSIFFLLTVLTGVEFLAGASIAIRHRKLVAAAAEPVRHEPEIEPDDEPQPAPTMRTEPKPPEMVTMTPAHEPKPAPIPAAVEKPATPPATERKVTGWTVADLVRDEPASDEPPKT